jgi:hypothetical protein
MKLRIKGNSLRLRLTKSEVTRLGRGEAVEESTDFGLGQTLRYRIAAGAGPDEVTACFVSGLATVTVEARRLRDWAGSDDVGIDGASGPLRIMIEKDFRCLTRPEEDFDPEFYPHPGAETPLCAAGHTH